MTLALDTPLGGRSRIDGLDAVDGRPLASRDQQLHVNIVGPRFLETMGVAIVDGRDFRDSDDERTTPKAIVSASLARRLFGHASAIGHALEKEGHRFEVVGVAADVRYESLREHAGDTVYFTYFQLPEFAEELAFALRTDGDPAALIDAVRQQVRDVSAQLPIYKLSTLDAIYDGNIATERLLATIAGGLEASRCCWSRSASMGRWRTRPRDGHGRSVFGWRLAPGAPTSCGCSSLARWRR